MTEENEYNKAKERVEEIKGFYVHLLIYIVVNIFLFIINIVTTPGALWFYWPLLGWGIGIAIHGLSVFVFGQFFGNEWEERKIKEIMNKDKNN